MVSFRVHLCCQGQGIVGVLQRGRHSTASTLVALWLKLWEDSGGWCRGCHANDLATIVDQDCDYWHRMIFGTWFWVRSLAKDKRKSSTGQGHRNALGSPLHSALAHWTRCPGNQDEPWVLWVLGNLWRSGKYQVDPTMSPGNCRRCFWRPIRVAQEIETKRKTCCSEIHWIMDQQYIYIYIFIYMG